MRPPTEPALGRGKPDADFDPRELNIHLTDETGSVIEFPEAVLGITGRIGRTAAKYHLDPSIGIVKTTQYKATTASHNTDKTFCQPDETH